MLLAEIVQTSQRVADTIETVRAIHGRGYGHLCTRPGV
jgi:hypothetical protein